MASYNHPLAAAHYGQPSQVPMPVQASATPAGTFAPGTKIQVGEHRVVIQRYLSEGGFAHVYLVKLPRPIDGTDQAVLKRVAVPDKETLRSMRTEVETMKRLKGHRPIVTYIDSHASELKGGGYEVFLLMEFCDGGGLIDFMNTRLQHRLTEPEIINIFSDIAEGVACMHYLKPPLLHRDLKVENVLIVMHGAKRKFKLCDFGSAAPPKPAPQTVVECRLIDEDIQRHTTMQYRSPEMVDVYRKQPIDEKSDIWALGVLLYKLCYYTTPFEDQGQLAILNASYRFPSYPVFSDKLKQLIASMLRENPVSRPNIYQVLRESCLMQGREIPIHDIYSNRSQSSEPHMSERQLPAERKTGSTPTVGAVYSPPPQQQTQAIPDITPMRRGRPATTNQAASSQPPKVTAGDPFAALDAKSGAKLGSDELSSRFPTLDQFSLLHDQGSNFDFDSPTSPQASSNGPAAQLNQRATENLADDAFASPSAKSTSTLENRRQANDAGHTQFAAGTAESHRPSPPLAPPQKPASSPPNPMVEKSKASTIISSNPELQAISSTLPQPKQEVPNRPIMVSTGTMTNPLIDMPIRDYPPIHRFPPADQHRSTSLPREQNGSTSSQSRLDPGQVPRPSPSPRIPSAQSQSVSVSHASSSRPSLEARRPSPEALEPLVKPSSSTGRSRPSSMYLESSMDYLREREASIKPLRTPGYPSPKIVPRADSPRIEPQDEVSIQSNVEFLRSMEDNDSKKKDRGAKHHSKRSSLGSLSGTKNILAGKFGDAFKRFEGNPTGSSIRTPSPLKDGENHTLTPIAGSEATDGRSDDGHVLGEAELTPEMRRELEAQSLADEERRVEAAAAEYKQKMAARAGDIGHAPLPRSIGGVSRAASIQNRVQNLLEESNKSSQHVQRTASGYGKFSDEALARSREEKEVPELPQRPTGTGHGPPPKPPTSSSEALARVRSNGQSSSSANRPVPPVKPNPAPKPTHLINLPTGGRRSPTIQQLSASSAYRASSDQLVGVGLPGRPALDMSFQEKEDYIQDFSKRFPSLSSIEMVERDIDAEADRKGRR
ncbi:kinase-like protein [Xylaria bambusicola]|uniref:kinase-like protein n=1 Tax=Xylaria bambusicola TaxID=326684 RepID=UPI0020087862|nr:kinase-like protein [Xylaria bambusicola]KAI0526493.1 kinase-like protein [Xylaria bambusicola]